MFLWVCICVFVQIGQLEVEDMCVVFRVLQAHTDKTSLYTVASQEISDRERLIDVVTLFQHIFPKQVCLSLLTIYSQKISLFFWQIPCNR